LPPIFASPAPKWASPRKSCELHRTEISLLERAGREPRLSTIAKLAGALETTPGALCEGIAWNPGKHRFDVKRAPSDKG